MSTATATPPRQVKSSTTPGRPHQPRRVVRLIRADLFRGALVRERKRADRSNLPLVLVLATPDGQPDRARAVVEALATVKRETDVMGWFERGQTIGLMLPEVPASDPSYVANIKGRINRELSRRINAQAVDSVSIQLHTYPNRTAAAVSDPVDAIVDGEQARSASSARYESAKRALDFVMSMVMLAILSPVLLAVAMIVKLTSRGPVFFRQERVGQRMKSFTMLKFRTMRLDADPSIHHAFVSSFIKSGGQASKTGESPLFKIANDPRVTTIGRILRATSLDELPQLWNVARGDMSLVGPRPPLRYEVDQYKSWHVRRVLEAKPGMTGLWQVTGRSRTTFDEMVRLDLRYARMRSVWTDVKILLATPRAVISGKGAC